MAYTDKQLSGLAGVSIRRLHYYDHIGLFEPSSHGENGYHYNEEEGEQLDFSQSKPTVKIAACG